MRVVLLVALSWGRRIGLELKIQHYDLTERICVTYNTIFTFAGTVFARSIGNIFRSFALKSYKNQGHQTLSAAYSRSALSTVPTGGGPPYFAITSANHLAGKNNERTVVGGHFYRG